MTRIGFRSTTVADESAIRSLLRQAHVVAPGHPMFEGRHLHWKYWEPRADWQGSRSYVLTREERIVAHAAIVPAVCSWGNERLRLLHVIDWAACPADPPMALSEECGCGALAPRGALRS